MKVGIFGQRIKKLEYTGEKNMNTQINDEDPNNDDNLINAEREDFLMPGMLGHVPDWCQEGPGVGVCGQRSSQ